MVAPHPRPDHSPSDAQIERLLLAFLRAEFQAPSLAMIGLVDLAREDALAAGHGIYVDDLDRMRSAAERLAGMIAKLLEETGLAIDGAGYADPATRGKLRHDLRTPVAAILGYGELLTEEAREHGHEEVLEPLAGILEAANRMLAGIDRLVDPPPVSTGDEEAALPDLLEQAIEVARHLVNEDTTPRQGATGRILIVDDTPAVLDLLSRRVSRDGHEVRTCESGEAALRLIGDEPFDLVLLDVMMPGVSGIEVLRQMKERNPSLPIVMVSALDEADAIVRCLDNGADDYLTKPVNATVLRSRIASSLDRKFLRDREQETLKRLRAEQERSEALLRNVLPEAVVKRLRRGEKVEADHFDDVTILFCDLVGFTELTAEWSPAAVLSLLNEMFSGFDQLATGHGLEKVKTIGDAYMAAGGLPEPRPDHAQAIARMALAMPKVVDKAAARRGTALQLRIGIATGPATAGIIGAQKFFYDVWGDTVNTASRMESTAQPGQIQMTATTREALGASFRVSPPEALEVKGKGLMDVFVLLGEAEGHAP